MRLINCTPHEITIGDINIPASGILPRVETIETEASIPDLDFPIVTQTTGEVEGLPESEDGTMYIVSRMVFEASDRFDLLVPDTGKTAVRDNNGRILGVTRMIRRIS